MAKNSYNLKDTVLSKPAKKFIETALKLESLANAK